jgi:hypothetical protein
MNFLGSDIQRPTLKLGAIRPVRAMPSIAHCRKAPQIRGFSLGK